MSHLTYNEFYRQLLDENYEYLNLSDPIIMDEFKEYVKRKYQTYLKTVAPETTKTTTRKEYFSDLQEKYIKGFNKECLYSFVPARIFFFQTLSLIFKRTVDSYNWDDRYYTIKTKYGRKKINPNLHFFWQQETSSGKSRGHKYFLKNCRSISKEIAKSNGMKVSDRYKIISTKWVETQETFINRFQQVMTNKGLRYDFTAPQVKGIFEEYDMIASEECAFLFNENRNDKQNISELLLDSLEGNQITKSLVSWNGNSTKTHPNFIFSGLSRPTRNISKDFFDKGLFQRMLVYTRNISPKLRMLTIKESIGCNTIEKSYIDMLTQEFIDLYNWKIKINPNELTYENEDEINELIKTATEKHFQDLFLNFKNNKVVRDSVSPFISRYYNNFIYILMILCTLSRKSIIIQKKDFIEADKLLTDCLEAIKLFAEVKIKVDVRELKQENFIKKLCFKFMFRNKNEFIEKTKLELFLHKNIDASITNIVLKTDGLIDIGFLILSEDKVKINNKDYSSFISSIKG